MKKLAKRLRRHPLKEELDEDIVFANRFHQSIESATWEIIPVLGETECWINEHKTDCEYIDVRRVCDTVLYQYVRPNCDVFYGYVIFTSHNAEGTRVYVYWQVGGYARCESCDSDTVSERKIRYSTSLTRLLEFCLDWYEIAEIRDRLNASNEDKYVQ